MPPPRGFGSSRTSFGKGKKRVLDSRQRPIRVALKNTPDAATVSHLRSCEEERLPRKSHSLDDLMRLSSKFAVKFPCQKAKVQNLIKKGVPREELEQHMQSAYPIIHHSCLSLLLNFLRHKQAHGSHVERSLYENMNIIELVDRLLKKRPMTFLGVNDKYFLPPPTLRKGAGGFEAIGTAKEKPPLLLKDFLSYDEIRLSALLSVSSWSHFINNGRRKNFGAEDDPGTYQTEGVIVGQVGPRLKKEGVQEYLDCMVTRRQNCPKNGFGESESPHTNAVWSKFWGSQLPTFQDADECLQVQQGGQRASPFEYLALGRDSIFNVTVYKKRIAITAEVLLCEANTRARACGKKAYVHVVGLGLGVWRAFAEQDELFVEAWGDALRNLTNLGNIAYVDFSYINSYSMYGTRNNQKFPGTDITIRFSKRNLHDKVPSNCILVCNYAWNGNSLPGNEFWSGKSCSTGDSAAASSSCSAELHNHFINPVLSGAELHVAVRDGRVLDLPSYLKLVNKKEAVETREVDVASLVIKEHVSKSIKRSSDSNSSPEAPARKKVKLNRESFQ